MNNTLSKRILRTVLLWILVLLATYISELIIKYYNLDKNNSLTMLCVWTILVPVYCLFYHSFFCIFKEKLKKVLFYFDIFLVAIWILGILFFTAVYVFNIEF